MTCGALLAVMTLLLILIRTLLFPLAGRLRARLTSRHSRYRPRPRDETGNRQLASSGSPIRTRSTRIPCRGIRRSAAEPTPSPRARRRGCARRLAHAFPVHPRSAHHADARRPVLLSWPSSVRSLLCLPSRYSTFVV